MNNIRKLKIGYYKTIMCIYGKTHSIEPKVVFSSFSGKQYSDNPKAISERLHELYPEIKQVWFLQNAVDKYGSIPKYIKIVSTYTDYYKELATSLCFITNENLPESIVKRKKQLFIQTWHGDRGFKKILYEAWEDGKRPAPVMDEFFTDLCVAGSKCGISYYRDGFHYKGEILEKGSHRNDILIENSDKKKKAVKDRLEIKEYQRVLLYAPTFRDNNNSENGAVNITEILEILNKNEDWICLVRLHPMDRNLDLLKKTSGCLDVTEYPDMAELLLITDLLITDYSSSAPDFVLTGRPVILATFDHEEYIASCRELKTPIEAPGFLVAYNQKQLVDLVERINQYDHNAIAQNVLSYYGSFETGKSSEEVCKRIYRHFQKFS